MYIKLSYICCFARISSYHVKYGDISSSSSICPRPGPVLSNCWESTSSCSSSVSMGNINRKLLPISPLLNRGQIQILTHLSH